MKTLQLIIIFIMIFLLLGCSMLKREDQLPSPSAACSTQTNWKGIVPGKSNKDDVIRILGKPDDKGVIKSQGKSHQYFAYKIEDGIIQKYLMDKFYFNSQGVVDGIEIGLVDRGGKFMM